MSANTITYIKNICWIGNSHFILVPKQFLSNQVINPDFLFKVTLEQTKEKAPPRKWLKPHPEQTVEEQAIQQNEVDNALHELARTPETSPEPVIIPEGDRNVNEQQNVSQLD